jgi:hypothetical protein
MFGSYATLKRHVLWASTPLRMTTILWWSEDTAGESFSTASGWHRKERVWLSITLKAHGSSA